MKRLYIIVEGQTEQEFVNSMIAAYMQQHGVYTVTPLLIRTSKTGRGGFVNYEHLKNDAKKLLSSKKSDLVVSTFVDFFRIPEVPQKERWEKKATLIEQVEEMEQCIAEERDLSTPSVIQKTSIQLLQGHLPNDCWQLKMIMTK